MYIYLDDSGNIDRSAGQIYVWAGFSIGKGNKFLQSELDAIISKFPYSKGGELKGKDASYHQKKEVFEKLLEWESLRICYLVADKRLATKNQREFTKAASRKKEQSENYFLSKVITRLVEEPYPEGENKAIIYIDGSPARGQESITRLHEYLSLRVNFPKWNDRFNWNHFQVNYNNEKNHGPMQAADFLANFILEYYKLMYYKERKNSVELRNYTDLYNLIQPKIHHRILGLPKLSLL